MVILNIFGRFRARDNLGNEIAIKSKKARALLAFLALSPDKTRSREELTALLWSDRADDQARGSLRQALSGLRRDLGDDHSTALKFVEDAVTLDASLITVEPVLPGSELLEGLHINDPAFDDWLRDERIRLESTTVTANGSEQMAPEPSDMPSIAVLPFANMSGDEEQEYFADGITEDIITDLSRFNSLFVISRNSSFHYKGLSPNVQDVGKELGVLYVVEGSVRRVGNRVRITAQLVEAETGKHLWAERYDRDLEDIFAVQDEVVSNIAMMVPGWVEVANMKKSARKRPADVTAYDLVLQSDEILYTNYSNVEGVRLLEQAIEIDPDFAPAHAKLAAHYSYTAFFSDLAIDEISARTRHHGQIATNLSPKDGIVHGAVAEAYVLIGEHDLAKHHADKAMSLNPNAFHVMAYVAEVWALLGDHDNACDMIDRAMQNDPYSAIGFRETKVDVYYMARRYEDCVAQLIGWPEPQFHNQLAVAAALAQLDRANEAKAMVKRVVASTPENWDIKRVCQSYHTMCAIPEDGEHWLDGFRKSGVDI